MGFLTLPWWCDINRYSEFINFPIYLKKRKDETIEVEEEEAEEGEGT